MQTLYNKIKLFSIQFYCPPSFSLLLITLFSSTIWSLPISVSKYKSKETHQTVTIYSDLHGSLSDELHENYLNSFKKLQQTITNNNSIQFIYEPEITGSTDLLKQIATFLKQERKFESFTENLLSNGSLTCSKKILSNLSQFQKLNNWFKIPLCQWSIYNSHLKEFIKIKKTTTASSDTLALFEIILKITPKELLSLIEEDMNSLSKNLNTSQENLRSFLKKIEPLKARLEMLKEFAIKYDLYEKQLSSFLEQKINICTNQELYNYTLRIYPILSSGKSISETDQKFLNNLTQNEQIIINQYMQWFGEYDIELAFINQLTNFCLSSLSFFEFYCLAKVIDNNYQKNIFYLGDWHAQHLENLLQEFNFEKIYQEDFRQMAYKFVEEFEQLSKENPDKTFDEITTLTVSKPVILNPSCLELSLL